MANPSFALSELSAVTNPTSGITTKTSSIFDRVFKNSYETTTKKGSSAFETVYIKNDSLAIFPTRIAYVPSQHIFDPNAKDATILANYEDVYKVGSAPISQTPKPLLAKLPELASGQYKLRAIIEGYVYVWIEGGDWAGFQADNEGNLKKIDLPVKSAYNVEVGRGNNFIAIVNAQDTPVVWMGYSRTKWTKTILEKIAGDSDFRQYVMKKINAADLGDGTHAAPDGTLGFLVKDDASNLKQYVQEYNKPYASKSDEVFQFAKTNISEKVAALAGFPQKTANAMIRRQNEDYDAYRGSIAVALWDAFGILQDLSAWRNFNAGKWSVYHNLHAREFAVATTITQIKTQLTKAGQTDEWNKHYANRVDQPKLQKILSDYQTIENHLTVLMGAVQKEWAAWAQSKYFLNALNTYDIFNKDALQALVNDYADAMNGAGWNPNTEDTATETPEQKAVAAMWDGIDGDYKNIKAAMTGSPDAWDKLGTFFASASNDVSLLNSVNLIKGNYADLSKESKVISQLNSFITSSRPAVDISKASQSLQAIGASAIKASKTQVTRFVFIAAFVAKVELAPVMEDTSLYTKIGGINEATKDLQALSSAQQQVVQKISNLISTDDKLSAVKAKAQAKFDDLAHNLYSGNKEQSHSARVARRNLRIASAEYDTNNAALAAALTADDTKTFKILTYLPKEQAELLTAKFQPLFANVQIHEGSGVAGAVATAEAAQIPQSVLTSIGQEITFGKAIGQWVKGAKVSSSVAVLGMFLTINGMMESCDALEKAKLNNNADAESDAKKQLVISGSALVSSIFGTSEAVAFVQSAGVATAKVLLFRALGNLFGAISSVLAATQSSTLMDQQAAKGANVLPLRISFWSNVVAAIGFGFAAVLSIGLFVGLISISLGVIVALLIIALVASAIALITSAFQDETSPLELWVNQCCLGKPLKSYPSYPNAQTESIGLLKAVNAITVDFGWEDNIGDDWLTLKVVAPTYNPGHSELAFAIYLKEEENSEPVLAYMEPSIVDSAHADLLPESGKVSVLEPTGLPIGLNKSFLAEINNKLVEIPYGKRESFLNLRGMREFNLALRILDEAKYSCAEIKLEYRPDAVRMPDMVITPTDASSNGVLQIED
jgi:hypothetical protein